MERRLIRFAADPGADSLLADNQPLLDQQRKRPLDIRRLCVEVVGDFLGRRQHASPGDDRLVEMSRAEIKKC